MSLKFALRAFFASMWLCSCVTGAPASDSLSLRSQSPLGRLYWGINPATNTPWTESDLKSHLSGPADEVQKNLRNILRHGQNDLATQPEIIVPSSIHTEHVLPTDPAYIEAQKAVRTIDHIFYFSFCARLATGNVQESCALKAREFLFGDSHHPGWVLKYQPTGNPIDEGDQLQTLFRAFDVFFPLMTESEKNSANQWLRLFVTKGDANFLAKGPGNTSRINNHNTWRLATRMTVATLLQDKDLTSETVGLIKQQVLDDMQTPVNWHPDPGCANNNSETLYGGFDFRQRDALLYHVYNLRGWIAILTAKEPHMDESAYQAVLGGLEFLKPYFTGAKSHVEFVCSKIPFDAERRDAGIPEYQNAPWKPDNGRKLLRAARSIFPEIAPWTEITQSEDYSAVLKLIAALQQSH